MSCIGDSRSAHRVLVDRPEGKRPPGRPKSKWEDNIETYFREIEQGDIN